MELGAVMAATFDPPKDGADAEESSIPALYTYFGQFVDHDVTFDPMTTLIQHSDPNALTDFRTPAFDLDNVYGRGPADQPYLYDNGPKFLLGDLLDNGAPDLPRNNAKAPNPRRALIGDPRNDENSIVSQLQALFLRFHNRIVDDNPGLEFSTYQRIVRFHYQWIVLNDFLSQIVSAAVLDSLKSNGKFTNDKILFFHWKNDPFMPVEFSVAAYRLGHSMVRPGYRLNNDDGTLLPIFPVSPILDPPNGIPNGLTGFQEMAKNRGIDWARFVDTEKRSYGMSIADVAKGIPADAPTKERLQFAYRIDTSLVAPLGMLPSTIAGDPPPSLPQRNLIRGFELGLPSGQAVAKRMRGKVPGLKVLDDDQILIGKATGDAGDVLGNILTAGQLGVFKNAFKGNCPLWTYILAEAFNTQTTVTLPVTEQKQISTPQLGSVGGRIVAEVFLGLMFGDGTSYLSQDPDFTPMIKTNGEFRLKDFVNYALGK